MNPYRIAVMVGSLRKASWNKKLADVIVSMAPAQLDFRFVRIDDLPLYNQDEDENQREPVRRMKQEVRSADGVLFVTPEYNRSIPGVLKNAIDHGSRPFGDSAWEGKPAGIVGASPGAMGSALSQQHLRNVLASLDMPTLAQPEAFVQVHDGVFDSKGGVSDEPLRMFLQGWLDRYAAWVAKFA
ncbi:NADPH-dependent FMN reductase [Pusillimonas noertemannii]|uniref:Chromate reductase n=1 Tax=Pusillimonas noertemannii TaxID=305977 RepID=A0A2U1CH89_9BURK|nr:NAD(P)H-dependent oxidoreductase [Pusillimonas noertemannii]NYT70661.1 NAD(P)H-dependent oxidoreductase [Pusillimonas noertemannii]PVY60272.1 chromate reductase [Pusillimonas noertemannii]TFL07943.1 NAD(P)H-dependent oxidoreductase [Pusillimonas noertemannii]